MLLKVCVFLLYCSVVLTDYDMSAINRYRSPRYYPSNRQSKQSILKRVRDVKQQADSNGKNEIVNINERKNTTEETTSTIETTTVEGKQETVSVPNTIRECPKGQSSFTKHDLILLINHFATEMNLIETINGSYYNHAISVRDKHAQTLKEFQTQFENRPKHLQHILDKMAQARLEKIEPLAKGTASELQQLITHNDFYNQKLNDANKILEKLEKSKRICELTCDSEEIRTVRKRSIRKRSLTDEVYYCATLVEIKEKITNVLSNFREEYIDVLRKQINDVDQLWEQKIADIKSEMKTLAVKEFGLTMYEVLSLQDEYNHFLNSLRNNNVVPQLSEIRKNHLQINFKLEELAGDIEKYRFYCLNCRKQNLRFRRDLDPAEFLVPIGETTADHDPINILEQLINNNIGQIKNAFDVDYNTLFEEIIHKVNSKDELIRDALFSFEPIQDSIKNALKEEEQQFNNVKSLVPKSSLDDLSKLNSDSFMLLRTIEDALMFISDKV